jgi:hypothetical protein
MLGFDPRSIRVSKSSRLRLAGHVAQMDMQPLRPGYRWVDNIKIDLREIGWDGLD